MSFLDQFEIFFFPIVLFAAQRSWLDVVSDAMRVAITEAHEEGLF